VTFLLLALTWAFRVFAIAFLASGLFALTLVVGCRVGDWREARFDREYRRLLAKEAHPVSASKQLRRSS
jgi:hypothetical protein